ncbi:hypothetical protein [Roseimicrobium sp. ORNL1]|uniref:hypothetical protein n=1 Tax=Roseimicrobium sp. ORNL1 TaxID=2711231 RepID=UPI0013E12B84|nr:hypothetical protein [Roseimicrobium sp. ORNL1]QIF04332.1 hypothetical protein G5S37_23340 [Roseimicrobium sp. ORNL1]
MIPTNRAPKLGIAALIVLALLLGTSLTFVGAVFWKMQANRVSVSEFEGFINYGTPIKVNSQTSFGTPTTLVLRESRIEQPVFPTRALQPSMPAWVYEWKYATTEVLEDLAELFRVKGERPGNTLPNTP